MDTKTKKKEEKKKTRIKKDKKKISIAVKLWLLSRRFSIWIVETNKPEHQQSYLLIGCLPGKTSPKKAAAHKLEIEKGILECK